MAHRRTPSSAFVLSLSLRVAASSYPGLADFYGPGDTESPTRSLKLVRAVVLEVGDVDRALRVDRDSRRHAQRRQAAARHVPLVDEQACGVIHHDAGVGAAAPARHVDAAHVIHG